MDWEDEAYFGIDKVARSRGITRRTARQMLKENEAYQRTQPGKRGPFNTIVAQPMREGRPDQIQGDLLDVHNLKGVNRGVRFLITLVDVYSRRAWVLPIKKKTTSEIMRVMEPWMREYRPWSVEPDLR